MGLIFLLLIKKYQLIAFLKKKNFLLLGSAHSFKEIVIKEKQGVKIIFLSPLFKTYKSNNYLDVNKFNILTRKTRKTFVALGGINQLNFKKLFLLKIYGFASISFFKKIDKMTLNKLITKHKNYISHRTN